MVSSKNSGFFAPLKAWYKTKRLLRESVLRQISHEGPSDLSLFDSLLGNLKGYENRTNVGAI